EDFRFEMSLWSSATTLPADYSPPPDAQVVLTLDESFTANPQSDDSAFVVTHQHVEGDFYGTTLLDSVSDKFRGIALVDKALELISIHHPSRFQTEALPGSDLFVDCLRLKADLGSVALPQIRLIKCSNKKAAKVKRIYRLHTDLLTHEPPLLRIRQGPHVDGLFSEVEAWTSTSGDKGNQDNICDALSLA